MVVKLGETRDLRIWNIYTNLVGIIFSIQYSYCFAKNQRVNWSSVQTHLYSVFISFREKTGNSDFDRAPLAHPSLPQTYIENLLKNFNVAYNYRPNNNFQICFSNQVILNTLKKIMDFIPNNKAFFFSNDLNRIKLVNLSHCYRLFMTHNMDVSRWLNGRRLQ